tara:strand:- start:322 stop:1671 length:1350 start_codon:yes stop_codon:yes gene_type:complete
MLRFAPSPTGNLHVGNARIALLNYLYSIKQNTKFFLRFDDTDKERSKDEFITSIKEDLVWLGIKFENSYFQSERIKMYYEITEELKKSGKLYACYETSAELDLKRKILLKSGKPPIYDRSSLNLTKKQINDYESEGRKPHWRLLLDEKMIEWNDLIHQNIKFENLSISDPVLLRSDNTPLFTLTSVVDDADLNVSTVLRGDDHITNTAAQIKLFQYINADVPKFAHFPLMTGPKGINMSKRLNNFSLKDLKLKKINSDALNTYLAFMGTKSSIEEIKSLKELSEKFEFKNFSKSSIQYLPEELFRLNSKHLKNLDYLEIVKITKKNITKEFWNAIRFNIESLDDLDIWSKIIYSKNIDSKINDEDSKIINLAIKYLPEEIDENSWSVWTEKISKKSGIRQGKKIFLPLRNAITGLNKGPEMQLIIQLLERQEIINRLELTNIKNENKKN